MIDLDFTFGNALVFCDEDGCTTKETFDDFGEFLCYGNVIDEMRRYGWRVIKKDGELHHICPSCIEKAKL